MESSFMSGKGDKKRQLKVSYETYAKNWDLIFRQCGKTEHITRAMKLKLNKEWFENRISSEDDCDVTAGKITPAEN